MNTFSATHCDFEVKKKYNIIQISILENLFSYTNIAGYPI